MRPEHLIIQATIALMSKCLTGLTLTYLTRLFDSAICTMEPAGKSCLIEKESVDCPDSCLQFMLN